MIGVNIPSRGGVLYARHKVSHKRIYLNAGEKSMIELPELTKGQIEIFLYRPEVNRHIRPPEVSALSDSGKVNVVDPNGNAIGSTYDPSTRIASAFIPKRSLGWIIELSNTTSPEREAEFPHFEGGQRYDLLITYPSTEVIKIKRIPLDFFQRAFDGFWNSYKPIESIKIDFNHDRICDQYSIGQILFSSKFPMGIPGSIRNNKDIKILRRYSSEFNHINVFDRFGEISYDIKKELVSTIQKIAFEHREDSGFRELYNRVYSTGSVDWLVDIFAQVVDDELLPKKSSNKMTISLKDEVAQLYNHNSKNEGVKTLLFKFSDDPTFRFHDINIKNIAFSVTKDVSIPGFKASIEIETDERDQTGHMPDELSMHVSSGIPRVPEYDKYFNINHIKFFPEILLTTWNPGDVENIYKRVFVKCKPNFEASFGTNTNLPDLVAKTIYNIKKEKFEEFNITQDELKSPINDWFPRYIGLTVSSFVEKFINKKIDLIVESFLGEGELCPIIDIKQIQNDIFITYVPPVGGHLIDKIKPIPVTPDGNFAKFDNLVVVMMENRSFDHMLGYLKVHEGRGDVNGLTGNEINIDHEGKTHRVFHNIETTQILQDPCHSYNCVKHQMGTAMDGFVKDFASKYSIHKDANNRNIWKNVMSYYGKEQVSTYDYIANNYAICDKWFCAHPGQTQPNRFITYTGKLNTNDEGKIEVDNPDFSKFTPRVTKTVFDYLTKSGVSWRVFEHGYSFLRLFTNYTYDTSNVVHIENPKHGFYRMAELGKLPAVTFIEPDYIERPPGNDDHPPGDIKNGQKFLAKVIKAVQESPQWEKTLLVITYDEHGGFYDHVMPPNDAIPLGEGLTRYGPRVPALVVSPFIPEKSVSHELFDHTSILLTILRRFVHPDNYEFVDLGPRVMHSNDLSSLLSLSTARSFNENNHKIEEMQYSQSEVSKKYKMPLPGPDSDDFHVNLMGYMFFMGVPRK